MAVFQLTWFQETTFSIQQNSVTLFVTPTTTTTTTTEPKNNSTTRTSSTLHQNLSHHDINKNDECLDNLGKNGTWVQNWTFAELYGQYQKPLVSNGAPHATSLVKKFIPSKDAPFRWETSWIWHDYYDNNNNNNNKNNNVSNSINKNHPPCQIDYTISGQDFCNLLIDKLHVDRIFFFGDSMAVSQYASLLLKLGPDYILTKDKQVQTRPVAYRSILHCNNSNVNHTIQIPIGVGKETGGRAYARSTTNGIIKFSNETQAFIQSKHPIYTLDRPIQNPNNNNISHPESCRSLIVLNLGAHYHDIPSYTNDIQFLFHHVQNTTTSRDIIFFRTTVSGHFKCNPRDPKQFNWKHGARIVPISDYETQYTQTTKYDWHLFDTFNAITKEMVLSRFQNGNNNWYMLDVYNMTILRHDGHVGGGDCLHYLTPGPVDWWNHLLYTHLKTRHNFF